ncbi:DUF2255 family protein [Planctomonas sp. JC2975]|uniref:DUF2255 family protein n=1 Tax=Planctomonas sp. JC2975 TaxID=2729626 RepID=UPI0014755929|nr:DUF2255 family protein [Planctomonas sp. JC2975]NNC11516.1 DUF2255 family protein [Planctomonas sp. JC2975]
MSATWNPDELQTIADEDEVVLASRRPDESLGIVTTIWIVRVGDDAYVRSAFGSGNLWYTRAKKAGAGHVTIGGISRDVTIEDASADSDHPADDEAIDNAYHAKYDANYPQKYIEPVVDAASHATTLRLIPA